ncbi:MAG: DUF3232 domain-containing protein [Candidatus Paceibacterota bacterium]|jgi:hypothetical protein
MEDPFLNDLWQDLGNYDKGETFEEAENHQKETPSLAYLRLKNIGEHSPLADSLVKDIQNSIIRYIETIDALTVAKIKKDEPKERERSDLARRLAHNALISNLNILNRYCLKNGLDTGWRIMIGSDRDQVKTWALGVAKEVIQERLR